MREGHTKTEGQKRQKVGSGYGVVAETSPWVATEDAFQGQPTATDYAVFEDGFDCIGAACGGEATGWRKHRRDAVLIEADREDEESTQQGVEGIKGGWGLIGVIGLEF